MVTETQSTQQKSPRRFTVTEYHQMSETGIFSPDEKVELINGEVVTMSPMGVRHASVMRRTRTLLYSLLGGVGFIDEQYPIAFDEHSEPEPDIMVIRHRDDYYEDEHPTSDDVLLIVEVSGTSLSFDTKTKLELYARNNVAEYWVIDIQSDRFLVHTEPKDSAYAEVKVLSRGDSFESAALKKQIAVNDCLGGG